MTNYRVGDYLIQIKNAALAKKHEVIVDKTILIKNVANVLKNEGVLTSVEEKDGTIISKLAFTKKEPMLFDLRLVSKPGLRIYQSFDQIKTRKDRSSTLILSTSKGVISSNDAMKLKVGGEVIAEIY